MSINLSLLPAPIVIENLSYEAILQQNIKELQRLLPDWQGLESDMYMPLLEAFAYRELWLRKRINNAAKAVLLPHAIGSDLDNLASFYNVVRKIVVAANPVAIPPILEVLESDDVLRQRIQLALYQFSTAGAVESYQFHAFDTDVLVKDVSVDSPTPGEVRVFILSRVGDGSASAALVAKVLAHLSQDKVRPLTDHVSVVAATIVPFTINATIYYYGNYAFNIVKIESEKRLTIYLQAMQKLGNNIHASAIHGALQSEGVQRVDLHGFVDVIINPDQAAYCTSYQLLDGGFDA